MRGVGEGNPTLYKQRLTVPECPLCTARTAINYLWMPDPVCGMWDT
jgi:hypothetical protein